LSFVTWLGYFQQFNMPSEDGYTGHKGIDMVSNNNEVGCGVLAMLDWY